MFFYRCVSLALSVEFTVHIITSFCSHFCLIKVISRLQMFSIVSKLDLLGIFYVSVTYNGCDVEQRFAVNVS